MGGSRNKGKKFLKQKQAKQKRRSPQKVKNKSKKPSGAQSEDIPNKNNGGLTRDAIMSLSNSDIYFHKAGGYDDGSEISDNVSLVSELTIAADEYLNVDEQQAAYNELDEHFDNLFEKDAVMRMTALNTINHALRRRIFDDYLRAKQCDKLYTLTANLRSSLLRGSAKEQCIALETCALVMLTLQGNHDSFVKQVRSIILKFIQSPHSRHVQIKAIEVWTCMTWVLGDNGKTQKSLELLDDIWMKRLSYKRVKAKFKAKNAQGKDDDNNNSNGNGNGAKNSEDKPTLGKQATYMLDSNDSSDSFSDDMDDLNLDNEQEEKKSDDNDNDGDSGSLGTMFAAASAMGASALTPQSPKMTQTQADQLKDLQKKVMPDNVAICAINNWIWLISSIGDEEAIGSLLDEYDLDFMDILEHNKNTELRCAAGKALTLLISNCQLSNMHGQNNKSHDIDIGSKFDNILGCFYEFVDESDIRRKNSLKVQKRKFRDYLRTLENKWTPTIKIKLLGKTYEMEGWCKWIQYHCLKSILKSGFQPHLLENTTIQSTFDMENVEAPQPLTQLEKKSKLMAHADDARQHKQKIKGRRQQKQAFMFNHSGTE